MKTKAKNNLILGIQKPFRLPLLFVLALGIVFPFPEIYPTHAAAGQITQTSQTDFQLGTAQNTLELNQSPGDVKLKQNLNTYTEMTKEEFDKGHSPVG